MIRQGIQLRNVNLCELVSKTTKIRIEWVSLVVEQFKTCICLCLPDCIRFNTNTYTGLMYWIAFELTSKVAHNILADFPENHRNSIWQQPYTIPCVHTAGLLIISGKALTAPPAGL